MASAAAERIRAELFGPSATTDYPLSLLDNLPELRARQLVASEANQPATGASVTQLNIAGVPVESIVSLPSPSTQTTILFLHGGGFIGGSCSTYRNFTSRLAVAARSRVLVPEYRLAPEYRFPAAIEDATAVYQEILREGTDARKLVTAGDSAGGGICAAFLLAARDSGVQMPAGVVLISPWMDLTFSGDSYRSRSALDPMDRLPWLRRMAELYLGGRDPTLPLASPIFGDLRGLPRTLIQVGDHEVLLDDSRVFFERAREKAVQAQIEIWPEMWHGWHMCVPDLPEANEAIRHIREFIRDVTVGTNGRMPRKKR